MDFQIGGDSRPVTIDKAGYLPATIIDNGIYREIFISKRDLSIGVGGNTVGYATMQKTDITQAPELTGTDLSLFNLVVINPAKIKGVHDISSVNIVQMINSMNTRNGVVTTKEIVNTEPVNMSNVSCLLALTSDNKVQRLTLQDIKDYLVNEVKAALSSETNKPEEG